MTEIFLQLLNRSISASWLILAVLCLRFLLKKAPKWMICFLWCLVGVRLILPVSIESVFSLIPSSEVVSREILYQAAPAIDSGIDGVDKAVNPLLQENLLPNVGDSVNPLQIVTYVVANLWILGIAALLCYIFFSYVSLQRRVREAVRLERNIYQGERVASPFVLGIINPRIYVPYSLVPEELECVIAHEQAHIKRRDHLLKPFAFLVLTIYWFHPMVWVAYILLCRDIEFACDEKVLRNLGMDKKKIYSRALLHCSIGGNISNKMIAACPIAFGEVGVKSRIKSVLHYKKPTFWILMVTAIASVVCVVCFMTDPKEFAAREEMAVGEKIPVTIEGEEIGTDKTEISGTEINVGISKEDEENDIQKDQPRKVRSTPPTMKLQDVLSATLNYFEVNAGTYSWNYPSLENENQMIGVDASGMAPQNAVKGAEWLKLQSYHQMDAAPHSLSFVVPPDVITVREYDLLELGKDTATLLAETTYKEFFVLELKPRRIYEVYAEWDEEKLEQNGFYGNAYYAFATDNTMAEAQENEGKPEDITLLAHVKEILQNETGSILISSDTDNYPGIFVVKVLPQVYAMEHLTGGESIVLTMRNTGELAANGLPVYEALYLEKEANLTGEEDLEIGGIRKDLQLGEIFTPEVNTLDGVTMNMYKYKNTVGDVEWYNETEREYLYGEHYDIQMLKDGDWYSIQPLAEIAYKDIAYSLRAGSGDIWKVNWEASYGGLPTGNYRIVKIIMEQDRPNQRIHYMAAEFEIMPAY